VIDQVSSALYALLDMLANLGRRRVLVVAASAFCVIVVTALVAVIALSSNRAASRRLLEIEIRASSGSVVRLFWSADQQWKSEQSFTQVIRASTEPFQHLRFPLPAEGMPWIRLDVLNTQGDVWLKDAELLDSRERAIGVVKADGFRPGVDAAVVSKEGDATRVQPAPGAHDASLVTSLACLDRVTSLRNLSRVTPTTLALATAATATLILACVLIVARAAFGRGVSAIDSGVNRRTKLMATLWLASLFLVVFSAKLLLIHQTPVTAPFWDQWQAEGQDLFVPYSECRLSWSQMFALHNEHRVFFTRLLALDLISANGQWDPRLEQVVNAALHASTAVLLAAIVWLAHQRRRLDLLVLVCGVVFAVPFGWENTLVGFQSSFYFFVLFSILALWLTTYPSGTSPWAAGWICATCALFSLAGGLVTVGVILGMTLLSVMNEPRRWRNALATLIVATGVLALGVATASPPIAAHAPLRAHSAKDFLTAFTTNVAWPWIETPVAGIAVWLPIVVLLIALARRRLRTTPLDRLLVGLSAWVALNAVAVAFGRGSGGAASASRYMDLLSIGIVANAMALPALLDGTKARKLTRQIVHAALLVWLVFAIQGVILVERQTRPDLEHYRQFWAAHAINVRKFVLNHDRDEFVSKRPLIDLPYPDPGLLVRLLENPAFRRILPWALREPLKVEPRTMSGDAFVTSSPFARGMDEDPLVTTWWSLSSKGRSAEGKFESQPVACQSTGRLKFLVAGYLGWENQYLALRTLNTSRDTPVHPDRLARENWADAVVPCPFALFEIVAIDKSPDSWFSFREPVEVGMGSLASEWLIERSETLFIIGLALVGLAVRWSAIPIAPLDGAP
jgi:hypothetical protein